MKQLRVAFHGILATALCSFLAGPGLAEETKGMVKTIQADNQTLVVSAQDGSEQSFKLSLNAKVSINDREGNVNDLRQGDEATIIWENRDGARVTTMIVVNRKK